MKVKKPS